MRIGIGAGAVGAALLLAACTSDGDPGAGSPQLDNPSTTATGTAPTTTGLPPVTFDACAAVDDSTFRQFGLDPSRKKREENSIGEKDIVACNILQRNRSISLFAQNVPWDDIPLSAPAQDITINGRQALYVPDSLTDDSCALLMRTDFGAVIIDTFPRRGTADGFVGHACDGVVGLAEAIEPLISDN